MFRANKVGDQKVSKRLLLGIDSGTSGCKLTVFDLEGRVVAAAAGNYHTDYSKAGYAEQDALAWWKTICQTLQNLGSRSIRDIAAIGVDGISWSAFGRSKRGPPPKSPDWLDRRAELDCLVTGEFGRTQLVSKW